MQEFKENFSPSNLNHISTLAFLEKRAKELEEEAFIYKKEVFIN